MRQIKIGWAVIGMIAAGCQSPSAAPVAAPTAPPPPPTTQAAIDPRVAAAIRQAQQHVRAVSEATFEPPPRVQPPADAVAASSPSASPTNPQGSPPSASAARGLKPVPSIEQLIASNVHFDPPGTNTGANTAVTVAPPAEVVAPPAVVAPPSTVVPPSSAVVPVAPPAELPQKFDAKARTAPSDFVAQTDAQIARVLAGQRTAPENLSALEPEDRDLVLGLADGIANFRALAQRDPNALPTKKIRPLLDMADRLRAKADLSIVNPSVVTRVRGFGSYDPILPLRLPAGIAHKPALYYEIENFSSRIDDKGLYRTNLRQDVVIYDAGGASVWEWPSEPVVDLCRRQRHDLYFAKIVRTPINLSAGSYTIKITLTDAERMAEASLPLVITPPPGAGAPAAAPIGPMGPVGPGGVR